VPEARLLDALWPQEDADDARRSLGAALHRLRGLLGCGDAIRQSGAMLTISRDVCWVDALTLDDTLRSPAQDDRVLTIYRGMLLEADTDERWAMPMRERWRARFVAAVERVGHGREESGAFAEALALYERGLEADPLIEGFHQGLMRCRLGLGRPAEAGSAYRRLQRTLAVALGSEPSPTSRAILEEASRRDAGHRETEGRASPG
jgi:DNA-binding SARP family transcriptional activator